MRKIGKLIVLVCLAMCALQAVAQTRADSIRQRLLSGDRSGVIVAAHRGDWRNFPENSLEGIESAIKMGVDIVEVDLQRTSDGVLILMHDPTLNRTTTGKGKIAQTPSDSIAKLHLRNGCGIRTGQRVPTLEQVLLMAKGRVMLNLDKADRYFDQVYALAQKTGTTRQIVMKGKKSPDEVKRLYGKYLNDIIYMPIVNLDTDTAEACINEFIDKLHPVAFELLFRSDTNKLPLKLAHSLTGRTLIWYNTLWDTMAGGHDDDATLKSMDQGWGYLIDRLGAHLIQTDRPQMMLNYLRSRGLHN